MENSIEFFLNTHLEWSLSRQDSVITNSLFSRNLVLHSIVSGIYRGVTVISGKLSRVEILSLR